MTFVCQLNCWNRFLPPVLFSVSLSSDLFGYIVALPPPPLLLTKGILNWINSLRLPFPPNLQVCPFNTFFLLFSRHCCHFQSQTVYTNETQRTMKPHNVNNIIGSIIPVERIREKQQNNLHHRFSKIINMFSLYYRLQHYILSSPSTALVPARCNCLTFQSTTTTHWIKLWKNV